MGTHFICTKGLACWSLLTLICRTLFLPLVQGERRVLLIECYHKEGMEGLEEWGGGMIFFMGSYFPPLLHSLPQRAWQREHPSRTQVLSAMSPAAVCQPVYLCEWLQKPSAGGERAWLTCFVSCHCSSWARGGVAPVAASPRTTVLYQWSISGYEDIPGPEQLEVWASLSVESSRGLS